MFLSNKKVEYAAYIIAAILLLVLVVFEVGSAQKSWLSLLPPLFSLLLAILTKNIYFSLSLPLVWGYFLFAFSSAGLAQLDPVHASYAAIENLLRAFIENLSDLGNILIVIFIMIMMVNSTLMILSQVIHFVVNRLSERARSARSAQLFIVLSGYLLFIDDYINAIVIGSSMRSLADRFKISREKFAFLVDATSAPVAGLALISTWIGYEVGLFDKVSSALKLNINGYGLFLEALPFRFYCIFMMIFVLLNVLIGSEYGPMKKTRGVEKIADRIQKKSSFRSNSLLLALAPILVLLISLFFGIWLDGKGYQLLQKMDVFTLAYWRKVLLSSQNSKLVFIISALFSFLVNIFILKKYTPIPNKEIAVNIRNGLQKALLPVAILILAWNFKSLIDLLQTGPFLVDILLGQIDQKLFPALVFITASIIAFITGTSYGTMGILIPLVLPIAFELESSVLGPVTVLSAAAVLDGAVFGDHCSPISDTTVMSSISCQCDHIQHVKTQIPYSLTVAGVSLSVGYLAYMAFLPLWMSYLSAFILFSLLFFLLKVADSNKGV